MLWAIANSEGFAPKADAHDARPGPTVQRADHAPNHDGNDVANVTTDTSGELSGLSAYRVSAPPVTIAPRRKNPLYFLRPGKAVNVDARISHVGRAATQAATGDEGMGAYPVIDSMTPRTFHKFGQMTFVADSPTDGYSGGQQVLAPRTDVVGRANVYASAGVTPAEQAMLFQLWGVQQNGGTE